MIGSINWRQPRCESGHKSDASHDLRSAYKKRGTAFISLTPRVLLRMLNLKLNESVYDIFEQFLASAFHWLELFGFQRHFFQGG